MYVSFLLFPVFAGIICEVNILVAHSYRRIA